MLCCMQLLSLQSKCVLCNLLERCVAVSYDQLQDYVPLCAIFFVVETPGQDEVLPLGMTQPQHSYECCILR